MNYTSAILLLCNRFFALLNLRPGTDRLPQVKSLFLLAVLFAAQWLVTFPARAEDWVTTDGTRYQDVHVWRIEDDAVTITYKNGGALVPLYKLPPSLQERFDYDPVKAKIAAEKRAKEDAENAAALQKEIEQAEIVKRNQDIQNARQRGYTNAASAQAP